MSLQIWLPLNGDLSNNGLMPITFSTTTANWNAAGKIGQAFSTLNSNVVGICPNLNGITTFSLTFWCFPKTNSSITTNWCNIIALGSKSADNSTSAEFRFESSYGNTYILSHHNNSGDPIGGGTASLVSERDKWYHIAIVVNNEAHTIRYYVNGTQLTTSGFLKTHNGGHLDGTIKLANESADPDCLLNDVRIYDHCLSQKEIKEISKALILHYTLDDFALKNNNIMPNYLTMNLGSANPSTGTWRLAGTSNMSRDRVQITDSPYGNCYGFQNSGIQTANDGSCYGIDSFPLEANTTYTISMFARITEGTEGYAGYNIYSATYNGGSWTKVDKNYYVTPLDSNGRWTRCWLTFTTNAATTRNIYIGITTGSASVTTQMCCIRIEKGIPNFNVIYDSSGYTHNIIPTLQLIDNINTNRYSGCMQFDGVTDHLIIPYNMVCPNNIFTMNLWFYKSELGSKSYETLVGGPSGFEMDTRAGASSSLSLYMASTRGGNVFSPFEFNKWYMVTMVRDGTNEMYYVNGELKKTIEAKAMPTGTYYIGSWASANKQNFKGLISDFRLYNSVLSASDIRELYEVKASVDHNSNFWSYEFQEVGS